jgi:NAD(P)-dependent dehydrogenase (short-subunit alcohol dehydrogenase family)
MATKWSAAQIPDQQGRFALVTGANSGIGYQAALELARHGAHVLLGCRSEQKAQDAVARLRAAVPDAKADFVLLDMASLRSIRDFAASFASSGLALDLLINNAGVMALPKRELTEDGFERQFGTNHLGHFALTGLLMPHILRAAAPRVITVASLAHQGGKIEFDNLQSERKYVPWAAYNASKLANILFARELDRRARESGSRLLSLPVHPGVSQTQIVANGPGPGDFKTRFIFTFAKFLTSPDSEGALPTLYAATAPGVHGGDYIGPDGFMELKGAPTVVKPRPHALDEATGRRLWEVSEQLTGVVYPPLS